MTEQEFEFILEKGIPPPEFKYDDFFTIIFKRNMPDEGLNEGLNDRQKLIVQTIKNYPGIQASRLAESLTIPVSTLERYIKQLIEKELIERRGSKKTGGYVLKQNEF